ncbi:MAG TPA: diguanylate cyclase [Gaiellaceae bacterium]|jgi:diguanylate cyclase (GGDEF)-like protein|nr:diguanylate cyclase [Gaiellaceae bacterium]
MGSFKLRLVTYFMLLSLLPLIAATWAFSEVARRGEAGSADARLSTALRVAAADHAEQVEDDAAAAANSLARATPVQRAFVTLNRSALVRISREVPHSAFYSGDDLLAGEEPASHSVVREADVTTRGGEVIGTVVVSLPLDDELVRRLRSKAGLESADRFVLVAEGRVIAPHGFEGTVDVPRERPRYVTLRGKTYRGIGTELVAGRSPVALLGLTPKSGIDAAASDLRRRFLLFALGALLAVGVLAYALGRTIVRSLKELADAAGAVARGQFERRVPADGRDEFASLGRAFNDMAAQLEQRLEELAAERGRVRDAVARFGEALAATHDPYALLPVIVGSTVEATGASGGRLVVDEKEIARAGDPDAGGVPLAIPLGSEGENAVLYLTPSGSDFPDDARELAHWLGSQASIALENARLHRLVERQASTDGLTELPNRRHFEEALEGEITRAERFGGGLALILADLDDFKQVNDRHGHQAGDDVLRTFASILRATVREIDLPARYGGEEFAVLLPQTDIEGANRLAERLRRELASRPMSTLPGSLVAVTASFGVAAFPDAATPAALFAAADDALYRAKRRGKNCVVNADTSPTVRVAD